MAPTPIRAIPGPAIPASALIPTEAAPKQQVGALTPQQCFERGSASQKKGDLDKAIQDLSEAIHLKRDKLTP